MIQTKDNEQKTEITFGTGNIHKLEEAIKILEKFHILLKHHKVELLEIQDNELEKIAQFSLENISDKSNYFVEDTGLFIDALKGFPGPYAAFVSKTIANQGIIKLLDGVTNRKAYFKSVIAFRDTNNDIHLFKGRTDGEIAKEIRGEKGFGFDPIFIPYNKKSSTFMTFAEMENDQKNSLSHRSKALMKLGKYLDHKNSTI